MSALPPITDVAGLSIWLSVYEYTPYRLLWPLYGGAIVGRNKAKEMKRRVSQRRATHKARQTALMLRAGTRMAAAAKAGKGKTEVGSKGRVKSTVKASNAGKR
jgi:hypothetical protein